MHRALLATLWPIRILRKGTNGVSTHGVTTFFSFFDGFFWVLQLTYFYIPTSARVYFFPNLSKLITFAAAPLVLTPFVCNQILRISAAKLSRAPQKGQVPRFGNLPPKSLLKSTPSNIGTRKLT